jgi:CRP-like cAMP-binding protein
MYVENEILKSLSEADRQRLSGQLKRKFFPAGATVGKKDDPIQEIFFPESGLLSLVTELSDQSRVGTGLIGKAGAVGASAALGINRHSGTVLALTPSTGYAAPAQAVLEIDRSSEPLRKALLESEFRLFAQARQLAACNARHNISQRLSS